MLSEIYKCNTLYKNITCNKNNDKCSSYVVFIHALSIGSNEILRWLLFLLTNNHSKFNPLFHLSIWWGCNYGVLQRTAIRSHYDIWFWNRSRRIYRLFYCTILKCSRYHFIQSNILFYMHNYYTRVCYS